MKESFILYTEYKKYIDKLSMEQRGELLTAIMAHETEEAFDVTDPVVDMLFGMIETRLARDAEKYEEIVEARREAGSHGGAPKGNQNAVKNKQNKQMVDLVVSKQAKQAKQPDPVPVPVPDNNYIADPDGSVSESSRSDVSKVLDEWNKLPDPIPKVIKAGSDSKRMGMLRARIAEYGIEKVLEGIRKVKDCPFLLGKNANGFVVTFDWFIRPNNFPKVLEGNYLQRSGVPPEGRAAPKKVAAQFNTFHQRDNDYESIQRALIAKQMQA